MKPEPPSIYAQEVEALNAYKRDSWWSGVIYGFIAASICWGFAVSFVI